MAASLELLEAEGLTGLTVHKVVAKAGSSVGSFYARFDGKEDLLDYLGERLWTEALERWELALETRDWSTLSLDEVAEGSVGLLIDAQRMQKSEPPRIAWVATHSQQKLAPCSWDTSPETLAPRRQQLGWTSSMCGARPTALFNLFRVPLS